MLNTFEPNKKQHIFLRTHGSKIAHCGNRDGKTTILAYEAALHATREYPHWWSGIEFEKEKTVSILIVGYTYALIYDTIAKKIGVFIGKDFDGVQGEQTRVFDGSYGENGYKIKFLSASLSEETIKSETEDFKPNIVFCDEVYDCETINAIRSVVDESVPIVQALTPYKFEYCNQTPTACISMFDCAYIDHSRIDALMRSGNPTESNLRVFGEQ